MLLKILGLATLQVKAQPLPWPPAHQCRSKLNYFAKDDQKAWQQDQICRRMRCLLTFKFYCH
jgi:hypothetical protein